MVWILTRASLDVSNLARTRHVQVPHLLGSPQRGHVIVLLLILGLGHRFRQTLHALPHGYRVEAGGLLLLLSFGWGGSNASNKIGAMGASSKVKDKKSRYKKRGAV